MDEMEAFGKGSSFIFFWLFLQMWFAFHCYLGAWDLRAQVLFRVELEWPVRMRKLAH